MTRAELLEAIEPLAFKALSFDHKEHHDEDIIQVFGDHAILTVGVLRDLFRWTTGDQSCCRFEDSPRPRLRTALEDAFPRDHSPTYRGRKLDERHREALEELLKKGG